MNKELMRKVLAQIEEHPETYDQGVWLEKNPCGTVGCIAGWACLLSGCKPDFLQPSSETERTAVVSRRDGGGLSHVETEARILLGLTSTQALDLFYTDEYNAKELLREWAK